MLAILIAHAIAAAVGAAAGVPVGSAGVLSRWHWCRWDR